jgi:hypothetical protein
MARREEYHFVAQTLEGHCGIDNEALGATWFVSFRSIMIQLTDTEIGMNETNSQILMRSYVDHCVVGYVVSMVGKMCNDKTNLLLMVVDLRTCVSPLHH